MKIFNKLVVGTFFVLLMMFSIQAKTVNLVDFGAVADDGNDDSQAIQEALNELASCGGGTLIFPSGVTEIQTRFQSPVFQNTGIKLTGDKGAVVKFNTNQPVVIFDFRDASQFEIEGLAFVGNSSSTFDATDVFWFENIKQIKISKSNFFGIGATQSVISFTDSFLSIEDSLFSGSAATDGLIKTNNSKGLSIVNTIFENIGNFRGETAEKTMLISQFAWVKVVNPIDSNSTNRGNVRLKDTYFDSHPMNLVYLENQLMAEINGVTMKLPRFKVGSGVYAKNVGNIEVVNTSFTETRNSLGAFNLMDNTYLNINGLILSNRAKIGSIDSSSQRSIGHCIGCSQLLTLRKK